VLQVINSSPGELTPVFDAILGKAYTLCGADHGSLALYDGERFHAVAVSSGANPFTERLREGVLAVGNPIGQPLLDGARFVHIPDQAEIDHPLMQAAVKETGARTVLAVPLRKDNGMIVAVRREVRPFADKQIALLQNFAAQAVIAMENARLLTETREALEQQTATAEVLQVINSSPGDLGPVFDAIVEKAMRLCGANHGILFTYDGECFHLGATHGSDPRFVEWAQQLGPFQPPASLRAHVGLGRISRGERLVHIADVREIDAFRAAEQPIGPGAQLLVRFGVRSYLGVALRRDDTLLGAIVIYRQEVRPFTDKQIALLENFAAQAVIAMENARLLTETREALEQQTATAEVLQVINSSPGDLVPVFDALLDKALDLCGAAFGNLWTFDGERFRAAALRRVPQAYLEWQLSGKRPPLGQGRFLDTLQPGNPSRKSLTRRWKTRT
jgi:GAF domain-containing protein